MRHRLSGPSTYGLNGQCPGDEHPRLSPTGVWPFTCRPTFTYTTAEVVQRALKQHRRCRGSGPPLQTLADPGMGD